MKVYVHTSKVIEIEIESEAVKLLADPPVWIDDEKEIEIAIEEISEKLKMEIIPNSDEMEINKDYIWACYADKEGYCPIFEM
jgi:hypothetical protein